MKQTFIYIGIAVVLVLLVGGGIFLYMQANNSTVTEMDSHSQTSTSSSKKSGSSSSNVSWSFSGETWTSTGTPPSCETPIEPPVDVEKATAILYPGQTRGGDYKPHGGFRLASGDIAITAPLDATVTRGSRYIEQGETQVLLEFVNSCGMMYRLDHLRTLSPAMQAIVDTFPAAMVDDSRTTNVASAVTVKAGDPLASAVGFAKSNNFSFDWGVYDLTKKNEASNVASYAQSHNAELAQHGVCWINLLSAEHQAHVKSLPASDALAGTTSDYCK